MTNYSDHNLVKEGSKVNIKLGYVVETTNWKWEDLHDTWDGTSVVWSQQYAGGGVPETVDAVVGYIDEINDTESSPARINFNIKGRDEAKRLSRGSEEALVFQSQQRFYADFTEELDYEAFMDTATEKSIWAQTGNYYRCETSQQNNFTLAGWYKEKNVWLETAIYFENSITDAKGGLVWRADADLEDIYCYDYYGFVYDQADTRLKLVYSDDETWTTLAEGPTLNWDADTWYYLLVIHINDFCFCYYSTDGITYNRAFSELQVRAGMTDYHLGYTGLYGYPATGGYVGFDKVLFRNLDVDLTVEDVAKKIVGMVGVLETECEAAFEDNFTGNGDVDWPHDGAVGTWTESSGRLVGTAPNGQWGLIRNDTSFTNFVCDFEMELPLARRAGIIFCADTNLQNYYLLEIEQFQGYYDYWRMNRSLLGVNTRIAGEESAWIRLHRCEAGTRTMIKEIRLDHLETIPESVMLSYRLSFQEGFISLWCDDVIAISVHDPTFSSGYLGFAVYSDTTEVYFDTIRVAKMGRVVPQWAVNVGEDLGKNLAKLLANESGSYYFDQSGTLVMGRLSPTAGQADVFGNTDQVKMKAELASAKLRRSDMDWVSVYRVDGETATATVRDADLLAERGYRFAYKKVKELRSVEDCETIGETLIADSKLKLRQYDFKHFPDLRIEKRDRIHVTEERTNVDQDFIVDGYSYSFQKKSGITMDTDLIDPTAS